MPAPAVNSLSEKNVTCGFSQNSSFFSLDNTFKIWQGMRKEAVPIPGLLHRYMHNLDWTRLKPEPRNTIWVSYVDSKNPVTLARPLISSTARHWIEVLCHDSGLSRHLTLPQVSLPVGLLLHSSGCCLPGFQKKTHHVYFNTILNFKSRTSINLVKDSMSPTLTSFSLCKHPTLSCNAWTGWEVDVYVSWLGTATS